MINRNYTDKQKQAFAERLKELRAASGLSQQKVANILNVTRSTYAYYELGKTMPNIFTLQKIAEIFEVALEDFLKDCLHLKIVS